MAFILPNQARVLNAYAALIGQTPGNGAMADHVAYLNANGSAGYDALIKGFFANVSNEALATSVLANLGLTNVFSLSNAVAALNSAGEGRITAILDFAEAVRTFAGPDAAMAAAAAKYNGVVDASYAYSQNSANVNGTTLKALNGNTAQFELTTGMDKLFGSDSTTVGDNFKAIIRDNANTLQSGDKIDGGAGNDTLEADIGNSQAFAITPDLTAVETVKIRVQAEQRDSGDNNIAGVGIIDAERSSGVTRWESNNSRADLIIEDVRIAANQATKDITIAMVDTDPGHVDFGVYFDQQSLRAGAGTQNNVLRLSVSNPLETNKGFDATKPLNDIAYTSVNFKVDGVTKTIPLSLANVDTYDQMWTALETAFNTAKAADASLAGVTLTRMANAYNYVSKDGQARAADVYEMAIAQGKLAEGEWSTAGATLPPNNAISANMEATVPNTVNDVITSTIVLDNVGRGSMGGDLVVGGLSVGETSTSKGVQKFEITVERSSQLQTINSTDNSLEQVIIKNGSTNGNLRVTGEVNPTFNGSAALPGIELSAGAVGNGTPTNLNGDQHNGYGFSDVRVLDASAMVGNVNVSAELTDSVVAKFMNRIDTQANINADNALFQYTLGSGNDTLKLDISASNLNFQGTASREDFDLDVKGGAGNDTITTNIINSIDGEGTAATWYQNQKLNTAAGATLKVHGGDGNDTINTLGGGDFTINGDAGDDTIYTDNSGATKEVFVFNAKPVAVNADLVGLALGANKLLYKAQLTVTVSGPATAGEAGVIDPAAAAKVVGFEKTVTVQTPGNSGYTANQGQINQAIKDAINSDPVLNKLLIAQDGPDSTVVITSLVDGNFATTDIKVGVAATNLASLNTTELAGLRAANGGVAVTQADLDAAAALFTAANLNPQSIVDGTASTAASDNIINGGTGNDVIVLSTGTNSGETVKYTDYNQGNDTIVNFTANTLDGVVRRAGVDSSEDVFDFSSYGVTSTATVNGVITQVANGGAVTVTGQGDTTVGNNEVAIIRFTGNATETFAGLTADRLKQALNTDGDTGADLYGELDTQALNALIGGVAGEITTTGAVQNHIVMVENAANLGEYKIFHLTSNGVSADFANAQFVAQADIGASLGTVGGAVVPPVEPGGTTTATKTINAAGSTTDGGDTVKTTYTIASGTYTHTIDKFNDGDVLKLFAGASTTVLPDADNADGKQTIEFSDAVSGTTTTIILTGLSAADDAALFNLASISTVFGAGTIA